MCNTQDKVGTSYGLMVFVQKSIATETELYKKLNGSVFLRTKLWNKGGFLGWNPKGLTKGSTSLYSPNLQDGTKKVILNEDAFNTADNKDLQVLLEQGFLKTK